MSGFIKKTGNVLLVALVFLAGSYSYSETISWVEATDHDLAGYMIYYGLESGVYTDTIDVGNVDSYCLSNLEEGRTYYFSVTSYDTWGNESDFPAEASYTVEKTDVTTGVEDNLEGGPAAFGLERNYPNPFNPETRINYSVNKPGTVKLSIYNISGTVVNVLVDKTVDHPMKEEVVWNGTDEYGREVSSGVYFCRLEQNQRSRIQRMVLAR